MVGVEPNLPLSGSKSKMSLPSDISGDSRILPNGSKSYGEGAISLGRVSGRGVWSEVYDICVGRVSGRGVWSRSDAISVGVDVDADQGGEGERRNVGSDSAL